MSESEYSLFLSSNNYATRILEYLRTSNTPGDMFEISPLLSCCCFS